MPLFERKHLALPGMNSVKKLFMLIIRIKHFHYTTASYEK